MSDSASPVFLVDGLTGQPVEAALYQKITNKHLHDRETLWKPWLEAHQTAHPKLPGQQSAHWDWTAKATAIQGLLRYPSFAIECCGDTQGLMIVDTVASCRLPSQLGKALVYVDFLEAAPWNRGTLTGTPRFKRVGLVLLNVALQVSQQEGAEGRIGLHSLPQSDSWYRDKCRMADLGPDANKQNLRYFEMTVEQANAFLRGGG